LNGREQVLLFVDAREDALYGHWCLKRHRCFSGVARVIELPLSQTPPSIPQPDETRSPTSRARVAAEEDSRLVATSVYEVLGELRAAALDEQDKGSRFERLIKSYLLNDPEWSARFSDVWLWSEWPGRQGRPDTGIDLVAAHRDSESFAAIQCKFYRPGSTVAKGEIDSFLSASSTVEFSARYIFDTAKHWSNNATQTLEAQAVPVQRVDIAYLDESAFDWSAYSWQTPEVLISTGKKALRPHQERAVEDVIRRFSDHDRGKLIMACGTGKTYTSLKIAESLVGSGGSVLFLVPSIQLLSQSLREWMANAEVEIRPFAVCSDVRVGRRVGSDDGDLSIIDLTEPATTNAATLISRMSGGAGDRMTVVFSTYQSIDVLAQAQALGIRQFDLVICDEAHRTTGVTLSGEDESAFVRVHDNSYLAGKKRLYMTATPRVFSEDVKRKAVDADATAVSMDNDAWYGPEFHRLGFGEAVEADLLTDYKVLVLAIDEAYVAENFQTAMMTGGEIALGDAAKLIGCWNGLAKNYGTASEESDEPKPMKTAVAFAKDIKSSKAAALSFPALVDRAMEDESTDGPRHRLHVEAAHVDGTMGIHERNTHLSWLKARTPDDVCRILSNARCLSEGVDVPALDAVMFLTPRGSQVDVVQSVGRVMRKAPGKELGYIILPVVIPTGLTPEEALKDNRRYQVVWQVLQALRSHDDRFHAMVNQIELNKRKTERLIIDNVTPRPESAEGEASRSGGETTAPEVAQQLSMDYGFDAFRDAMYARIVQKVGERRYWETWARDVAEIAQAHITRIKGLLSDRESEQSKAFEDFLSGLRGNLNESITGDEAVEMLAQHLVTRPIFQALFAGYNFAANNPVAKTMESMLATLDEQNLVSENVTLERFYDSVRRRVEGVDNAEGKQRILIELYEKFFATAFRRTVDKLGIVYTPVEIVDFILKSADDVLRAEFGQGLTDEDVHILDGFTGTGTFIVRFLQSGLVKKHDLARKYANELHANEILLLAYYIAAVNIESTYADLTGERMDFPGLILTDTFQSWEPDDRPDLQVFPENNARLEHLKRLPITVIVGNPPYSAGQDSANDDNRNDRYPALDGEIRATYAQRSTATLKNSLYDSYIRAIKWATLRISGRGVIAYVTNGAFLDSNTADGLRQSLADEFSSIYVFNLRGNQRTTGEQSRREGGKIFGGGSRATVAVTLLVRNPVRTGPARIYYTEVDDYLSREDKLALVRESGSVLALGMQQVASNAHGDWIKQRRHDFLGFLPVGDKSDPAIFATYSGGPKTNRDAWAWNFGRDALGANVTRTATAFNEHIKRGMQETPRSSEISWSRRLSDRAAQRRPIALEENAPRKAMYRPFVRQWLYDSREIIDEYGRARQFLRSNGEGLGFVVIAPRPEAAPGVLMVDCLPDLSFYSYTGQFFGRSRYESRGDGGDKLPLGEVSAHLGEDRVVADNITDVALRRIQATFDEGITKDDIFFYVYGVLHSPEYRDTYSSDLKKMLPRIPLVRDFMGYAQSGRALSDLHLGYESVQPFPLDGLDAKPQGDPYSFYEVGDRKMSFGKAGLEQMGAGRRHNGSIIHFNERITVRGIPEDAYRYMLGSRSAIEWIIDRYYVKTDKDSGIVNDPNDWSREVGDPRYILDLLARVVTVSVETMKIVDALPPLDIIESD
jgi:predicted helicase